MKIVIGLGQTEPFESGDAPGLLEMARLAVTAFADVGATHARLFAHHSGDIDEYPNWVTQLGDEQGKRFE
jgi:hypothetical protein